MALPSSVVLVLASLVASITAEPIPRPQITGAAVVRRQNVPDDCTFFDEATSSDQDCEYFAATWGITVDEFIAWNPDVGEDCSGIKSQHPHKSASSAPAPTSAVPSPVQDGIIETCTSYYQAVDGDNCSKIVEKYGTFKFEEFLEWNPAVGETCTDLWLGYYYCVGVPSTPTTPPTTTTTKGSDEHSPSQTGIVEDCQRWHKAEEGDTCASIVSEYRTFTLGQFQEWNPAVGSSCSDLWLGYWYCIGVTGTPTEAPEPTTTAGCTSAPAPTQPGVVCECTKWHKVADGDSCWSLQQEYDITAEQFQKWNPEVGADCSNLWLGYSVCVNGA